jgi:plastocyanin
MKRLVAVLAALLAFTACSSSTSSKNPPSSQPAAPGSGQPSGAVITIKNFGYTGSLTVKAGTKVTVVNDDSVPHTLTDKKRKFDTGSIGGGGKGSFTAPSQPGKYPFGCTFHPEMAGTLTVTS